MDEKSGWSGVENVKGFEDWDWPYIVEEWLRMKEVPASCCCFMVIAISRPTIFWVSLPSLVLSPLSSESWRYQRHVHLSPDHLLHYCPPPRVYIVTLLALSRRCEHQRWPTDTRLTSRSDGMSDWSNLLMKEAVTGRERIRVRNSPPPFSFLCSPPSVSLSLFPFLCLSLSVSLCLSAWWCRAGQVSVIQGCKPEEDWIYL